MITKNNFNEILNGKTLYQEFSRVIKIIRDNNKASPEIGKFADMEINNFARKLKYIDRKVSEE